MSFELLDLENHKNLFENVDNEIIGKLETNTEIALFVDEFENVKTIKFTKSGFGIDECYSKDCLEYFKLYSEGAYYFLGFSFINHNKFPYIEVYLRDSSLNLALGDYLIILFEDGHKIKYTFEKARSGNQYHSTNIIPLNSEILSSFLTKNIEKVKVVSTRKNLFGVYNLNEKSNEGMQHFKYKYTTKIDGQLLLKYMSYKFIEFNLTNKI